MFEDRDRWKERGHGHHRVPCKIGKLAASTSCHILLDFCVSIVRKVSSNNLGFLTHF